MVYKKCVQACAVVSFKLLLEMFPLIYNFFCFIFENLYKIFCIELKSKNKYFYCDDTCYLFSRDKGKKWDYFLFPLQWPFLISRDEVLLPLRRHCTVKLTDCAVTCSLLRSVGQFAGSSAPHCDGSTCVSSPGRRPPASDEGAQRQSSLREEGGREVGGSKVRPRSVKSDG